MPLRTELEALAHRHGWAAVEEALVAARSDSGGALATLSIAGLDAPESEWTASVGDLPSRYEDLGLIGVGGMGVVRRVRDVVLGRVCALKVAHTPWVPLVEEARIGAQLQHPGVPPVYDAGRLADGRGWFTMKEVEGRTLKSVNAAFHAGTEAGWPQLRLLDAFAKVCDALAYGHARGVVHGDVKSSNVVVGAHGEALVVDWGLARSTSTETPASAGRRVAGTLAYLAPEQVSGRSESPNPRTDVYALGALLYELLAGKVPYPGGDPHEVLQRVLAGPPVPLADGSPVDLVALSERCMARDPAQRPAHAGEVAAAVRGWLDGVQRRARALAQVDEATRAVADSAGLRARAAALRTEAAALLADVKVWEPEARKAAAWERLDDAEALDQRAALALVRREQALQAALSHEPTLVEAHEALASDQLEAHRAAERARDPSAAARVDVVLARHAEALPAAHPLRAQVARYRQGDGALSLVTDPPGATVQLMRYQEQRRRLVPVDLATIGPTPLRAVPLAHGSYLAVLRHPERATVQYPIQVGRGEHWDGVAPAATEPTPVRLPEIGELGEDEVYVPAGWYWTGGDPVLAGAPSARAAPVRRWCDALVVARFPVTNREFLAFLNDLVATGREDEAEVHVPQTRAAEGRTTRLFGCGPDGRYALAPDADGDLWNLDWPVIQVDWFGARAYLAWLADRTGRPWRLPGEYEWEKAARGVDGRYHPWGDRFDYSWCCMSVSHEGLRAPAVMDRFPVDQSPYGVRHLAGNVQEWCLDLLERPPEPGPVVAPPEPGEPEWLAVRMVRGGAWSLDERYCRSAARPRLEASVRTTSVGFRGLWRPA